MYGEGICSTLHRIWIRLRIPEMDLKWSSTKKLIVSLILAHFKVLATPEYSVRVISKPEATKLIRKLDGDGKLSQWENSRGLSKHPEFYYQEFGRIDSIGISYLIFIKKPQNNRDSSIVLDVIRLKSKKLTYIDITHCTFAPFDPDNVPTLVTNKTGTPMILSAWVGDPITGKFVAVPKNTVSCNFDESDEE